VNSRRSYDSPTRARQARETRRAILEAAAELFTAQGYGRTSVGVVAARAGVTAQTIYNAVGSKQALLKAAYDVTLVGDDEPVSLADRPDVRAMYALTDPVDLLHAYARLGRRVAERVGPLMLQIAAGAAAGDPDLVEHQQVTDNERLVGTGMVVRRVEELGGLAAGLDPDQARDRIWTLNCIQVWDLLTRVRGWTGQAYEQWIGDAMCAAILDRRYWLPRSTP
jgi:AcrR family transcriptional regulator